MARHVPMSSLWAGPMPALEKEFTQMNIRKTLLSGMLASSLALGATAAFAQEAPSPTTDGTPMASPVAAVTKLEDVPLVDADGNVVANVDVWEDEDGGGVWFSLTPGEDAMFSEGKLGVHIHETGTCDADVDPPFDSAGGHFNPDNSDHGDINADPSHAGDLGNLEVDADGNFGHEVLAEGLTMMPGMPNSLADDDGSAIIIHSGEDDFETQPSGDSGERMACGEIFPSAEVAGTPEATPADPMASPTN